MSILENRPIRAVAIAAISLFIVAGAALAANGHPLVLSTPTDSASPSAALDTSSPGASDTSMPSAVVTVPPVGDETQPPDKDGDRSAAPAASQTPDIDATPSMDVDKTQPPDLDGDRTAAPSSGDQDGDKGSGGSGDGGSGGGNG
jgi:hypothetical protein